MFDGRLNHWWPRDHFSLKEIDDPTSDFLSREVVVTIRNASCRAGIFLFGPTIIPDVTNHTFGLTARSLFLFLFLSGKEKRERTRQLVSPWRCDPSSSAVFKGWDHKSRHNLLNQHWGWRKDTLGRQNLINFVPSVIPSFLFYWKWVWTLTQVQATSNEEIQREHVMKSKKSLFLLFILFQLEETVCGGHY